MRYETLLNLQRELCIMSNAGPAAQAGGAALTADTMLAAVNEGSLPTLNNLLAAGCPYDAARCHSAAIESGLVPVVLCAMAGSTCASTCTHRAAL
jgi:hypothetical protein